MLKSSARIVQFEFFFLGGGPLPPASYAYDTIVLAGLFISHDLDYIFSFWYTRLKPMGRVIARLA